MEPDFFEYANYDFPISEIEKEFQKTDLAIKMKSVMEGTTQLSLDDRIKLHGEYRQERKRLGLYVPEWAPANSIKTSYEAPKIKVPSIYGLIPLDLIKKDNESNSAKLMMELYEEIKHGDEEHQEWLKEKIKDFIKRRSI